MKSPKRDDDLSHRDTQVAEDALNKFISPQAPRYYLADEASVNLSASTTQPPPMDL